MKNEALEFATYLETQLVPDFREADMTATADDFATAARFIRGLAADPAVAALVTAARAVSESTGRLGHPVGMPALDAALAPFTGDAAPPVDPPDDRRPVWSFEVDGQHVRWCGTLDQWHKDRVAYVDKSEGTWEAHGPRMCRFVEPAGPRRAKRTSTIFRAVKNK